MKKIKKPKGSTGGILVAGQVKKLVTKPVMRRIDRHAIRNLNLGRRIFKKLQAIEGSIEIIAREINRRAKWGE